MKRDFAAIRWLALAAVLAILWIGPQSAAQTLAAAADGKAAAVVNKERESWDILLMQGKRLGYSHTTARLATEAGRQVLRTESFARISLPRENDTIQQDIRSTSIETPDGKLLRFESEMSLGPTPIRTNGRVKGDRLEIETTAAAAPPTKRSIAWSADFLGPAGTEQSLLRKPMQPGERRTLDVLMAEFQQVAKIEMAAKKFEPCKLQTGTHELLRIDTVVNLPGGQKFEQTVWTDRTGDTLKSLMPAGQVETYRVSKAEALQKIDAANFDLLSSTMIKVEPPLTVGHRTKQVRYRVHLDGSDPASAFISGATQAVKSIDANTADVTVYAIRPGESGGIPSAPADPPTAADLEPNAFVQSNDPLIVADAKKAAGDETDPWRVAVALERYVNREVKSKNYSQGFASAAEVAKSLEGDCTEHSVFLMALCRARGIPARAAMGLVYLQGKQAFFYHMWTEVYIDKRWIPIDGTMAQGGIGAAHLKIAQSSLKDASAYSAFLPVMQVMGRLSIKVVEAK